MENNNDVWQTEVNGQIFETNFDELTQWIAEGSLQPQDKVRRGNLRWLEANKVPVLNSFFNAKDAGFNQPTVSTTAIPSLEPEAQSHNFSVNTPPQPIRAQTFDEPPPPSMYPEIAVPQTPKFCVLHDERETVYYCETCCNDFCYECPIQNVCPMCGSQCSKKLEQQTVVPPIAFEPQATVAVLNEIDPDVKKGANWFYWIAALSVINSIIMLTGTNWAFAMGLGITQIFDGIADLIATEMGLSGVTLLHLGVFIVDVVCAGFFVLLGFFAGNAKKWAFVVGIVLYSLDGLIYLLSGSILGIAIHALAIFSLVKGMSAIKK